MYAYQSLESHLNTRSESSVRMTYAEIERVLGRKLPPSAYGDKKRQWWANTESHSQALAWLRSNRKAKLDVRNEQVEFVRQTEAEVAKRSDSAVIQLESLSPAGRRMLEDLAEERGVSLGLAASELLNEAAYQRRAQLLDWFKGRSKFSTVSSAEMVREDRDAR